MNNDCDQSFHSHEKNKCRPVTLNLQTSHEVTGTVWRQEELQRGHMVLVMVNIQWPMLDKNTTKIRGKQFSKYVSELVLGHSLKSLKTI